MDLYAKRYVEVKILNRNDLPAPNKTCEVCGRQYRRCKKCAELKRGGIEAWREHCDSMECYQTLIFSQIEDYSKVTREEYDRIIAFELPDGRKPIEPIQEKLNKINEYLEGQEGVKARKNFGTEPVDKINSILQRTSAYNNTANDINIGNNKQSNKDSARPENKFESKPENKSGFKPFYKDRYDKNGKNVK